jgi:anthranilate synthase
VACRAPLRPLPIAPTLRAAAADSDHGPGEYAGLVERAKEPFYRGDLFEVVWASSSPTLPGSASTVFHRLAAGQPAPYGALINLGEGEFLVPPRPRCMSASRAAHRDLPDQRHDRARPRPARDAERIRELLNSTKDESELTMCTDVDRNDKSRVCVPAACGHRPAARSRCIRA